MSLLTYELFEAALLPLWLLFSRRSAIRGAERDARGREKWREKTGKPGIRKSRKGNFISLSLFSYATLYITKKVVTVPSYPV